MSTPENDGLAPADIAAMPLILFERYFGFRPRDALEKKWFAITRTRITPSVRAALEAGTLGNIPLNDIVMTDM